MLRLLRLLVLTAVLSFAVSFVIPSGSPSATNYVCAKVWTAGTVLGVHTAGTCTPWTGPTLCADPDAGLNPHAHVYTLVCIPD